MSLISLFFLPKKKAHDFLIAYKKAIYDEKGRVVPKLDKFTLLGLIAYKGEFFENRGHPYIERLLYLVYCFSN